MREIRPAYAATAQRQHHGQHLEAVRVSALGQLGAAASARRCRRRAQQRFPFVPHAGSLLADRLDDVNAHLDTTTFAMRLDRYFLVLERLT